MVTLFDHQKQAVEIARKHRRWLYQDACGTGKTIGTLAIINERPIKTLVLAPKAIVESAWCADGKMFPSLNIVSVLADTKHKVSVIRTGDWHMCVTNFDQFKALSEEFRAAGVRRLVVDEASKIKTPTSATSKKVLAFADWCDEVYLLSANPSPNGPHELWASLRAIQATSLPMIKWMYRFFYPIKENVRIRGGQVKPVVKAWKQSPGQRSDLETVLRGCSRVLRKEDCLTLPPQMDRIIRVRLSSGEAEAYRAAVEELRVLCENGSIAAIKAGAALVKTRQIVGGAVLVDGEPQEVGTSKIDALSDVLDEIGPEPVVIWWEFVHERRRIEELLVKRGETYGIIDGETSGESSLTAAMFQDSKLQRLLCHPQSAGHGLTLTAASHAIYFSINFSHDLHMQSRDRIHRAKMKDRPATYHYLLAELPAQEKDGRRTVDDAMMGTLRRKAKAADGIMDALRDAGCRVGEECAAIGE